MQIVTSIEQFGDLKNMSVEEVVGRLKVHEERHRGYEDKEEEKYLLLTHEGWLPRTKKKDADGYSFSGTSGHGNHNKEKNVVAKEVVTILHKPMKMATLGRTRVWSSVTLVENMSIIRQSAATGSVMRRQTSCSRMMKSPH